MLLHILVQTLFSTSEAFWLTSFSSGSHCWFVFGRHWFESPMASRQPGWDFLSFSINSDTLRYIKIDHCRLFPYSLRFIIQSHPAIPFCIVCVVKKKTSLNRVEKNLHFFNDIFTAYFSTLAAQLLKIQVLWDVTPCRMLNRSRHFEGAKILSGTLPLTDTLVPDPRV